jgi:hypothetical protein
MSPADPPRTSDVASGTRALIGTHFVDRAANLAPSGPRGSRESTDPSRSRGSRDPTDPTDSLLGSLEAAAHALSAAARWLSAAAARWRAVEIAVDGAAERGGAVALGPVAVDAGALRRLAGAALAWATGPTGPTAPVSG